MMQPESSVWRIDICYSLWWKPQKFGLANECRREMSMNPEMDAAITTCGNCRSPMPRELRFCRNCGYRLGEGTQEYTETVRFQNAPPGTFPANGSPNQYPYGFPAPMTVAPGGQMRKRRRRMSGMTWMFLSLLIFFIAASVFTAVVKQIPRNIPVRVSVLAPKSYSGVDDFETADGGAGVTFENVEPADGPADKAGLVGGDIITAVNGEPIGSVSHMRDLMTRIPSGTTLDIDYLRDGELKHTKLTTISKAEMDRLGDLLGSRPEGRGQFGYEDGEAERVEIPNTKMFGVQLGEILANRPADLAGIKQGDIIIKFGDTPIRTTDEFLSRVRRALPYSTVTVTVIRNGERLEIPVKMGKQG